MSRSHVEGPCKEFYQREGERLLNWDQGLSGPTIQLKLRNRKKWIRRNLTDEPNITKYNEEMARILKFVCEKCGIQGPLLDSQDQRVAYGLGKLSNAEISGFSASRRVSRVEPPISSTFDKLGEGSAGEGTLARW